MGKLTDKIFTSNTDCAALHSALSEIVIDFLDDAALLVLQRRIINVINTRYGNSIEKNLRNDDKFRHLFKNHENTDSPNFSNNLLKMVQPNSSTNKKYTIVPIVNRLDSKKTARNPIKAKTNRKESNVKNVVKASRKQKKTNDINGNVLIKSPYQCGQLLKKELLQKVVVEYANESTALVSSTKKDNWLEPMKPIVLNVQNIDIVKYNLQKETDIKANLLKRKMNSQIVPSSNIKTGKNIQKISTPKIVITRKKVIPSNTHLNQNKITIIRKLKTTPKRPLEENEIEAKRIKNSDDKSEKILIQHQKVSVLEHTESFAKTLENLIEPCKHFASEKETIRSDNLITRESDNINGVSDKSEVQNKSEVEAVEKCSNKECESESRYCEENMKGKMDSSNCVCDKNDEETFANKTNIMNSMESLDGYEEKNKHFNYNMKYVYEEKIEISPEKIAVEEKIITIQSDNSIEMKSDLRHEADESEIQNKSMSEAIEKYLNKECESESGYREENMEGKNDSSYCVRDKNDEEILANDTNIMKCMESLNGNGEQYNHSDKNFKHVNEEEIKSPPEKIVDNIIEHEFEDSLLTPNNNTRCFTQKVNGGENLAITKFIENDISSTLSTSSDTDENADKEIKNMKIKDPQDTSTSTTKLDDEIRNRIIIGEQNIANSNSANDGEINDIQSKHEQDLHISNYIQEGENERVQDIQIDVEKDLSTTTCVNTEENKENTVINKIQNISPFKITLNAEVENIFNYISEEENEIFQDIQNNVDKDISTIIGVYIEENKENTVINKIRNISPFKNTLNAEVDNISNNIPEGENEIVQDIQNNVDKDVSSIIGINIEENKENTVINKIRNIKNTLNAEVDNISNYIPERENEIVQDIKNNVDKDVSSIIGVNIEETEENTVINKIKNISPLKTTLNTEKENICNNILEGIHAIVQDIKNNVREDISTINSVITDENKENTVMNKIQNIYPLKTTLNAEEENIANGMFGVENERVKDIQNNVGEDVSTIAIDNTEGNKKNSVLNKIQNTSTLKTNFNAEEENNLMNIEINEEKLYRFPNGKVETEEEVEYNKGHNDQCSSVSTTEITEDKNNEGMHNKISEYQALSAPTNIGQKQEVKDTEIKNNPVVETSIKCENKENNDLKERDQELPMLMKIIPETKDILKDITNIEENEIQKSTMCDMVEYVKIPNDDKENSNKKTTDHKEESRMKSQNNLKAVDLFHVDNQSPIDTNHYNKFNIQSDSAGQKIITIYSEDNTTTSISSTSMKIDGIEDFGRNILLKVVYKKENTQNKAAIPVIKPDETKDSRVINIQENKNNITIENVPINNIKNRKKRPLQEKEENYTTPKRMKYNLRSSTSEKKKKRKSFGRTEIVTRSHAVNL